MYGWLTAQAISLLGTRVSMLAIPWLVLTTTGSATQTGLVAAVELTPLVVFKAVGGPLVDRLGPRRVALTVGGLPAASPDVREDKRGPRVGAPQQAIEGFLKSAGLASIEEARIEGDRTRVVLDPANIHIYADSRRVEGEPSRTGAA